jgi:hypothetical protein
MPPELGYSRFLVRCDRVRENNGTINLLFVKRADYSDQNSQEEALNAMLLRERGPYSEGNNYWITIEPAHPRG